MDRVPVSLLAAAAGVVLYGCGQAPAPTPTPDLSETITGLIYCDNQFEFYFNGELVATDPLDFRPHQAVNVSFTWDGVSDKVYAIKCQDYATESGYEYTEADGTLRGVSTNLGDGALLAKFSDGTRSDTSWVVYTQTYGPTQASIDAGCNATALDLCEIEDRGYPTNWETVGFDDSAWIAASTFDADTVGWGRTPTFRTADESGWSDGTTTCGELVNPLTGYALTAPDNYMNLTEDYCLDPRVVMCGGNEQCGESDDEEMFIWNSELLYDNIVFFRLTVPAARTMAV